MLTLDDLERIEASIERSSNAWVEHQTRVRAKERYMSLFANCDWVDVESTLPLAYRDPKALSQWITENLFLDLQRESAS